MTINKNLISIKCVLFLFFGALGALFPFLPVHMNKIELSRDESIIISAVAPVIALLGPLIAAPLADRLAGGFGGSSRSKTGRYLRVMIAICLVLATLFYWLLALIPPIHRNPPNVSFMCNEEGGFILQDRCGDERTCYDWNGEKGSVLVTKCIFTCNATSLYKTETTTFAPEDLFSTSTTTSTEATTLSDDYYVDATDPPVQPEADLRVSLGERGGLVPNPHMCYHNDEGDTICEVYTEYSKVLDFTIGLKSHPEDGSVTTTTTAQPVMVSDSNSTELLNVTDASVTEVDYFTEEPNVTEGNPRPSQQSRSEEDICRYPFDDYFHCRITQDTANKLRAADKSCKPLVLCEVVNPYNNTNSLLKKSQCGFNNISFWLYLFLRSIADIFPATAVTLLATAVVIATRETSTGRGDVGKQYAFGALGFAIFAPIIGGPAHGAYINAMICFTVLMVLAVLVLLFDNKMPLSPPEWWWHTRCGLLALPMSSVRQYGREIAALAVVLLLLGVFWNAIDTFLPWHLVKLAKDNSLIIGLTITVGSLPAVVFLYFAEKIVDYCSHANILILCFVNYIVHHIALYCIRDAGVLLVFEVLEIFTLHLMYVTAVLYLRHLVPRKFTACGQALPIIAHFCLGRCFGALLGSQAYTENFSDFIVVQRGFAIAAAVIAIIYFLSYHFYMKPKCAANPQLPPYPAPSVVQSMNGNGSYTPLRVYHNGRAKKGHFRY